MIIKQDNVFLLKTDYVHEKAASRKKNKLNWIFMSVVVSKIFTKGKKIIQPIIALQSM